MKEESKGLGRLVGLAYDPHGEAPPQVSLKLEGEQVRQALAVAKRYGVPIRRHGQLLDSLQGVEEDDYVPESLFKAVAAILREVLKVGPRASRADSQTK